MHGGSESRVCAAVIQRIHVRNDQKAMEHGLRGIRTVRFLVGAAMAAALVSVFAMPASAVGLAHSTVGRPTTVTLHWLSRQQYVSHFKLDPEKLSRTPIPAGVKVRTVRPASVHPDFVDYTIRFTGFDDSGRDLPTRNGIGFDEQGDEWGYAHYSGEHNLTSSTPVLAAYDNNEPDVENGDHLEYVSVLTDSNGNVFATIRAVNWQGETTQDGRFTTPDGRPIGTITAFCEGVTLCPDIVNQ